MADNDRGPSVLGPSVPTPVVGYETRDDRVVVTATNEAFETAFGAVEAGRPLTEWLTTHGVDEPTATEIASSLADGASIDTAVRLGGPDDATPTRYRLRPSEPVESGEGYCLLTEQQPASTVEADRLASVISHDLRNPLDVAQAHLREARETGREEHFDHLAESHERMERIIRDVLTLTRGESALNRSSDVDIGSVATDAWATVDTEAADLTVAELPSIEADPDRLTRLFENLFRNSVEHARPADDESIAVHVGPLDSGFYVADDGVGVPAAERDRVFDPGYTTETTSAGTGLGLTIVEEIADAHDWTVSLTESRDGGARFEFRHSTPTP
jgi:signal transduction histidine kinase